MTTAVFAPAVEQRQFDESKHVNYTLGMLLGVDDFRQEFAYLSGRDKRLARDAVGYGTLSGLGLAVQMDAGRVRVAVGAGTAVTPRGEMVCVRPSQCAYLDDWFKANAAKIVETAGSAPQQRASLYVVLCYHACESDVVPFPGESCRSDRELTIHSRITDSFHLELRPTAPKQLEEDNLREFVAWLRKFPVSGTNAATLGDFEKAVRKAIQEVPPDDGVAPRKELIDVQFDTGAHALNLDPLILREYLRIAFRVWVTDVRPRIHALCPSDGCSCCGSGRDAPRPDECVLLGRLSVPVVKASSGDWEIDQASASKTELDESQRPYVMHTRMLQEMLLGFGGTSPADAGSTATSLYQTVAAGLIGPIAGPVLGGISAIVLDNGLLLLTFQNYIQPSIATHTYIVNATPVTNLKDIPRVAIKAYEGGGIALQVVNSAGPIPKNDLAVMQFAVEVNHLRQ